MYDQWGTAESLRIFYLLGRYIRQNSWQLFFFIDVTLTATAGSRTVSILENSRPGNCPLHKLQDL
jgi:hypothetical protein